MFRWLKAKSPLSDEKKEVPIHEDFSKSELIYRYFTDMTGIHFDQKESIVTPKLIRFAQEFGCRSFEQLHEKLHSDPHCEEALINLLTVNETYFFREMAQIEYLAKCLKKELVRKRILCAPGSSGEEPYSIAISLMEQGIDLSLIEILSIDINTDVIAKAEKGIYPARSLYRLTPEIKERYFNLESEGYRVIDPIRKAVKFRACNLFEAEFLQLGQFHVIFSRNMLIYFDAEVILKAVEQLKKVAYDERTLFFFGHADIVTKIASLNEHYSGGIKCYTSTPKPPLCEED